MTSLYNRISFALGFPVLGLLCVLVDTDTCIAEGEVVLRFRQHANCKSNVAYLRDLVEVVGGNSPSFERLLDKPLGPAPRTGTSQTWTQSDVMNHLRPRGVHSDSVRWQGVEVAQIQRRAIQSAAFQTQSNGSFNPAFVSERAIKQAEKLVAQAISDYLDLKSNTSTRWIITAKLPVEYTKTLLSRRNLLGIAGGKAPWVGEQIFQLQVRTSADPVTVAVKAIVKQPPMVVVASQPLRREQLVTEKLLKYSPLPHNAKAEAKYYQDIEQLVGLQMRRSLSTGLPLTEEDVGPPVVIERGELITIESVAGNITVSTQGKALSSGAVGEAIEVELSDRKRLLAVVVGSMTVRVAATADEVR